MKFEIPKFKRCCFCVPLRYGLLVWSYLLLVPLLLVESGLGYTLCTTYIYFSIPFSSLVLPLAIFLLLLVAIGNTVLLIVAAHMKKASLLNTYCVSAFWTTLAVFILIVSRILYLMVSLLEYGSFLLLWRPSGIIIVTQITYLAMQMYIIALVKSEVVKLESNHSFRYVNPAAMAESAYGQLYGYIPQPEHDTENMEENKQTDNNVEEKEDNVKIYLDVADK